MPSTTSSVISEFWDEIQRYDIPFFILEWGYTLVPIVGAVMLAYHVIARLRAQDDYEAAQHRRAAHKVAVGTALVFASLGLLEYLVTYTKLGSFDPCYGLGWKALLCPPPPP